MTWDGHPPGVKPDDLVHKFAERRDQHQEFETGAFRNSEEGKLDYEGFLSPLALERYAEYMHKHRHLEDGRLRDSDNWQKGVPRSSYMKSMWRHLITIWNWHRQTGRGGETIQDALCGVIFNAMGYLHEVEKEKRDG